MQYFYIKSFYIRIKSYIFTSSNKLKTNTMKTLEREYFEFDVKFSNNLAKWENHKHPENPNFQQVVNWAAWESNNNLVVCYYLDKTKMNSNHIHSTIPMNGKTFEEAVFEYWKNN